MWTWLKKTETKRREQVDATENAERSFEPDGRPNTGANLSETSGDKGKTETQWERWGGGAVRDKLKWEPF